MKKNDKKENKTNKKTVVSLKNSLNPNKVISKDFKLEKHINNKSHEVKIKEALTKDIVLSELDKSLTEIIHASHKDSILIKRKISELLKIYNERNIKNAYDILNIESLDDIYDQDKGLRFVKDYKAFVYYFWNPENMNYRIIGLRNVNPLFEIIETKELFFLDKPTMSTLGKPVFWLIKGVPLSQKISFSKDYNTMSTQFTVQGYNASQIYAMVKSPLFMSIFGKHQIPLKTYLLFICMEIITILICYIFFSTIFMSTR